MADAPDVITIDAPDPAPAGDPAPTPPAGNPAPAGDPAPETILNPAEPPDVTAPQTWPEEWRQSMVGEKYGDKELKQLERIKSPEVLFDRFLEQQKQISKGLEPLALNDKSTDEDISAYREANGIPAEAADYGVSFSDNMEPTEEDTLLLDEFKNAAHADNIPTAAAQKMLDWYEQTNELKQQDMAEHAAQNRIETTQALQAEWGGEYSANINAIETWMNGQLGEEGHKALAHKQFTDGSYLGDNPEFLRMVSGVATDHVGPNAIFAGDIDTVSKDINERKAEIMKLRANKNKGDLEKYNSPAIQDELQNIYSKQDKISKRKGS